MKVAIWANSPSLHQRDFYQALRDAKVDLQVRYFGHLAATRRAMGWMEPGGLPQGEQIVPSLHNPLQDVEDWRERVHIIPGYSHWANVSIALALSRAGVPWAHWSENAQPSWRSPLLWAAKKAYAQLVNRCALGAFALGEAAGHDFVRWGIRRELIAHLHYAVSGVNPDAGCDDAADRFIAGRMAFLYVGTICRNKATKKLIRAFALATEQKDACLVIVGDGPQRRSCEILAIRLGVAKRVLFRGVVPNAEVGAVMKCCHVAVLPSRYDGWGVVLNEAASAGLALVASDGVGAAYHLIEPGINGFRVKPGNVRSLASALRTYIQTPQLARSHGERSLERFQDFRPERNAERLITAIGSWLAMRSNGTSWGLQWSSERAAALAMRAA